MRPAEEGKEIPADEDKRQEGIQEDSRALEGAL
jgi:hypothetical protein